MDALVCFEPCRDLRKIEFRRVDRHRQLVHIVDPDDRGQRLTRSATTSSWLIDGLDPDDRVPIDAAAIRYRAERMGRSDRARAAGDDEIGLRIPPGRPHTVDASA